MYAELKHPSFYSSLGFDMAGMLLAQLAAAGFAVSGAAVPTDLRTVLPVVLQCFEADTLRQLKGLTDIPLGDFLLQ